ncbi:hypothetical protein ACVWZ3_002247 [Bradyrhizobium sp. i1.3.6]
MAAAVATVVALAAAATPVLAVVALAADIWASGAAARISVAWRVMEALAANISDSGGHVGNGGIGLRQHAFHRFGRNRSGYGFYGAYPDCYDWYELHPDQPLPLSCS